MVLKLMRPMIKIKDREFCQSVYDVLIQNKIVPFIASILARRIYDPNIAVNLSKLRLESLSSPFLMKNMDKACDRII